MLSQLLTAAVWLCLLVQAYHYVGYPLLLALAARLAPRPVRKGAATPKVSLIISCFNEAAVIREKLDNSLALDYPGLEIVINSEGSTDALVPLARSLTLRTSGRYALYVTAICGGAFSTHVLVPPTPGPLAMADTLGIDLGLAIAGGLVLGIVPAIVGLMFARAIDRRLEIPLRDTPGSSREELEALACGVPVIGCDVGGLPEVVRQGETGVLGAPGDVDGLGSAAVAILTDDARWQAMSIAAAADARARFSEDAIVPQYEALYRKAVTDRPRPGHARLATA